MQCISCTIVKKSTVISSSECTHLFLCLILGFEIFLGCILTAMASLNFKNTYHYYDYDKRVFSDDDFNENTWSYSNLTYQPKWARYLIYSPKTFLLSPAIQLLLAACLLTAALILQCNLEYFQY